MRIRRVVSWSTAIVATAVAVFFLGPRVDLARHPRPFSLPKDVEGYLARTEGQFDDIAPGAEKSIVWAGAKRAKTPFAIVYLHGFSATRQETFPLCDLVAARLGANLHYTRLTGHGRGGRALAEATVSDWLNDAAEAFAIGERLGDKVIVIGTSTGGTLATWLALQPHSTLHACVLLSPNFAPRDPNATVLTWPWARQLVPVVFDPVRRRTAASPEEQRYWTTEYPTVALLPMMGLVKLVADAPLEDVRVPVLAIFSPEDRVVDPAATQRAFARFRSPCKRLVPFADRASANHHVLAGNLIAPANTAHIAETILAFLEDTGAAGASTPLTRPTP
jgi:esterase/lipase